jgi:hypothetical protein
MLHKDLWAGALKLLMPLPEDFDLIYSRFRPEWADFIYRSDEDVVEFQKMLSWLHHR